MSVHRLSIDTTLGGQFVVDQVGSIANDPVTVRKMIAILEGIAAGTYQGKIRMNLNAAQASGTITFSSIADSDTVTINGVTLTAKTTPSGTSQFATGSTDQAAANNLMTLINASALAKIAGGVSANRRLTFVPSGMLAGDTVTINGIVFTVTTTPVLPTDVLLAGSDAGQASNFASKINSHQSLDGVLATASGSTVTVNFKGSLTGSNSARAAVASNVIVITSTSPGQMGNLGSLAISAHGSVSAANLTGGTEGTEIIYASNNANAL